MDKKPKYPPQRRLIGMYISGGGGKVAYPSAHAIYELTYLDGDEIVTKIERGASLRTLPGYQDFNGTKKQKERASLSLAYQLEDHIRAAGVLVQTLERACVELDDKLREEAE